MLPGDGAGLTLDQVLALQAQHPHRFAYAYKPNLAYTHIDLQLDNPGAGRSPGAPRAADGHRPARASWTRMMGGRVPVADGFVNPQEPQYAAAGVGDLPPTTRPAARALLAELPDGPRVPDGVCRNAAGQRLSLHVQHQHRACARGSCSSR